MSPKPDTDEIEKSPALAAESTQQSERTTLGKYELIKKLGSGGMGTVYLAVDSQLKRTVALKVLPRSSTSNRTLVRRFQSEAQASARLKHDNIVTVFDAGEAEGYLYIALEYVEGSDVHRLVHQRGKLSVRRTIDIVRQVALALEHAHEKGIVHRDIKPSNLLIAKDGSVKLTDMGLARSVDETAEAGITRDGTTVGTVDYMAPEQARDSKAADIRSDIYSLGCTWYQMLTGKPPFVGSLTNKLYAHVAKPRPDPREKNKSVPEVVVKIMHRMMAKKRKDRYQTPAALLNDLERIDLDSESSVTLGESDKVQAALSDVLDSETRENIGEEKTPESIRSRETSSGKLTLPPRSDASSPKSSPSAKLSTTTARRKPGDGASANPKIIVAAVVAVIVVIAIVSSLMSNPDADENLPPNSVGVINPTDSDENNSNNSGTGGENHANPPPPVENTSDRPPNNPGPQPNPNVSSLNDKEFTSVPPWVAASRSVDGTSLPAQLSNLPVLTVGRNEGGPSQFMTIGEAIQNLPGTGGIVQLIGDGPFVLPAITIENRGQVVIRAQPGSRPLILLNASGEKTVKLPALLSIRDCSLFLLGVDLVVSANQFPTSDEVTLIDCHSGDLVAQNVSVTLYGSRPGHTTAFRMSGVGTSNNREPATQSRLLLERCFVRGDNLTTVNIEQSACDAVLFDSLFASRTAPVIVIGEADVGENNPSGKPARVVRIFRSTLSADRVAIEAKGGGSPPSTRIHTQDCVIASRFGATQPTLLALSNWPKAESRSSHQPAVKNLLWTTTSSLFTGWHSLVRSETDSSLTIRGGGAWERFWRSPVPLAGFQHYSWPKKTLRTLENCRPADFDSSTVPDDKIKATDGGRPGSSVAELKIPKPETLKRGFALADRPAKPTGIFSPNSAAQTVEIDLNRRDLGREIELRDWPSGTLIRAFGSGNVFSSPIRIHKKTLRIEFRQDGDEPLTITPRSLRLETLDASKGAFDAFVSVKDGHVEIVGGQFIIPVTSRGNVPSWFLHAHESSFSLQHCRVFAPLLDNVRFKGMIRWTRIDTRVAGALGGGRYRDTSIVADSFLAGPGKLIEADLRGRALLFRNSVLASLGNLCEFDITSILGPQLPTEAVVDFENCTVSAGGAFFRIETDKLPKPSTGPLQFFIDRTVFSQPAMYTEGQSNSPMILVCSKSAIDNNQITWWGNSNGYDNKITSFVKDFKKDDTGKQDFDAAWRNLWGAGHILRSLNASGDVRFRKALVSRTSLPLSSFALDGTSNAASWSVNGSPIGADVSSLRFSP